MDSLKHSYKPSQRESLSLAVYNTGFEQCAPGYAWGPAVRDHYLIHYVVAGRGAYEVDGRTFTVQEGDAFLVYPSKVVCYTADLQNPWAYYWVGFNGMEAGRLLKLTDFTSESPVRHYEEQERVSALLAAIYDSRGSHAFHGPLMTGNLYLFLSCLIQLSPNSGQPAPGARLYLEQALRFIEHNYSHNIDVGDVARSVGVSRSHLYRVFAGETGLSPSSYLMRYRIGKACALLSDGRLSIKQVALSVGFSEQLYFARVFKRLQGVTPSQYRDNLRAQA